MVGRPARNEFVEGDEVSRPRRCLEFLAHLSNLIAFVSLLRCVVTNEWNLKLGLKLVEVLSKVWLEVLVKVNGLSRS